MKNIHDLEAQDYQSLRKQTISNIKDILMHNKNLTIEMIQAVGIIENGKLQVKVPMELSKISTVKLIGYLKWFWDIKDEEIQWTTK